MRADVDDGSPRPSLLLRHRRHRRHPTTSTLTLHQSKERRSSYDGAEEVGCMIVLLVSDEESETIVSPSLFELPTSSPSASSLVSRRRRRPRRPPCRPRPTSTAGWTTTTQITCQKVQIMPDRAWIMDPVLPHQTQCLQPPASGMHTGNDKRRSRRKMRRETKRSRELRTPLR